MKKVVLIVSAIVLVSISCKKKTKKNEGEKLFTFNSLTVDNDTILKGNITNVKANITGSANYVWSASAGDIFNSGAVVVFGASTCCTGNHNITCKVTDANGNSEEKTISVFVK